MLEYRTQLNVSAPATLSNHLEEDRTTSVAIDVWEFIKAVVGRQPTPCTGHLLVSISLSSLIVG